ncbi:fatty acid desaturase-domain-containing protein [Melanogaster broomeanus]|nr:fatty acid desaturase-domain-containing protein [Melanogaster broomeanus]KAF9241992.1 fatty acid desaturase-domain-containing protein [Melanogaster broomeanus]
MSRTQAGRLCTVANDPSPVRESSSGKPSVFQQLKDFRSNIPKDRLTEWERPTGPRSIIKIIPDWTIILAGHQMYIWEPSVATFLAAMVLMAWGQRGLSNLAHDAIHGNFTRSKKLNDSLADAFLAPPLMSTAYLQRQVHTTHHHYLGTENDPNHGLHNDTSLKHYRNGRFDHTSMFSLFFYDAFDHVVFFRNVIGFLPEAPFQLISWWTIMTVLMGFLEPNAPSVFTVPIGWRFFMLFHATRCTLTYCCYIFREIIDHSGLPSTSVLEFTRTSPCCNLFQKFLHPHDDNYHLLHHLLPRVPTSKLHESHLWLVDNVPVYEQANRYTSYFSGERPLFAESLHRHIVPAVTQ